VGADVIKIEHPVTGDAQRGLINAKFLPQNADGVNYMLDVPNRGKRSLRPRPCHRCFTSWSRPPLAS